MIIIGPDMPLHRSFLRLPAFLGLLLLLFAGTKDAYGLGVCPMHGGGDHSAAPASTSVDPAPREQDLAGGTDFHHGGHHSSPSESPQAAHHAPASAADSEGHGAEGCECRLACLAVTVPTPPEAVVLDFDPFLPLAPIASPVEGTTGLRPALHPPHHLPFANGPPTPS